MHRRHAASGTARACAPALKAAVKRKVYDVALGYPNAFGHARRARIVHDVGKLRRPGFDRREIDRVSGGVQRDIRGADIGFREVKGVGKEGEGRCPWPKLGP
jgi:hypothetical protein